MIYKQNLWTEDDILSISDEDDKFERKAGMMFDDKDNSWRTKLASEVCAFANSYGGVIALGAYDTKEKIKKGLDFDGVNPIRKKQPFEQWLESRISGLLTPPLQSFRVLRVQPRLRNSLIPTGKSLYIIEIDESEIAPHQTNDERRGYYYREGTSAKPAPHLYLEGLRSSKRFVSPLLVRAWLDTFLLDFIELTRNSADNFYRRRFVHKFSDKEYRYHIEKPTSESKYSALIDHPNAVQFFSYYPQIEKQLEDYQSHVNELQSLIGQLIHLIGGSSVLKEILDKGLTKEDLIKSIAHEEGVKDFV